MIKTCPQCKNTFKTPASVQIYCNKKCYGLSQRKPPHLKRTRRDYYLANREAIIAKMTDNYRKNPGVKKLYARKYMKAKRAEVLAVLGGKCNRCGFSDFRALQVDHVHGGGRIELLSGISSYTYMKRVLSDTTGKYQLLCANCNWIKKYENSETGNRFRHLMLPAQSENLPLDGEVLLQN